MPYPPCTWIVFWLKYQDSARMLRRVTLTNYTGGPLAGISTHNWETFFTSNISNMKSIITVFLIIIVTLISCKKHSVKYVDKSLLLSDWIGTTNNAVLYFEDSILFQTILPYSEKVVRYKVFYDTLIIYSDDFEHLPMKPSNQIFKFKVLHADTTNITILQVIPKIADTLFFTHLKIDSSKYFSFNKLELSHGICFGHCPAFDLKIDSDSMYYYYGYNSYVKHNGLFQHKLTPPEYEKIQRRFNYIHSKDSLTLEYPSPGTGSYNFFIKNYQDSIEVSGRYSKSDRFNDFLIYLRYLDWMLSIEPLDHKEIGFRDRSNYQMFVKK